jgi:hypothetical protein
MSTPHGRISPLKKTRRVDDVSGLTDLAEVTVRCSHDVEAQLLLVAILPALLLRRFRHKKLRICLPPQRRHLD